MSVFGKTSIRLSLSATLLFVAWSFTGCTESEESMTSDTDDFGERIRLAVEEFENRTIYSTLDADVLTSIPDDKLEQAIIDYISIQVGDDWENSDEIIGDLPDSFRGVYATWVLEAQVNNGGFNQYFWNGYGYFADDAISAFEAYGTSEYAEVTKKAVAMYLSEIDAHQEFRDRGTLDAFSESYKHTELGDVDGEFWDIEQNLSELRIAYVRANPEQFFGD